MRPSHAITAWACRSLPFCSMPALALTFATSFSKARRSHLDMESPLRRSGRFSPRRQPGVEQRRLLRLLLEEASWKEGELRMSLHEPLERLRVSNRANTNDSKGFERDKLNFEIWRRVGDSNSYVLSVRRFSGPLGHLVAHTLRME